MTTSGGSNGDGNIFSVGTNGANYQNLLSFSGAGGPAIGAFPTGSLALIGSTLYGMTPYGGTGRFSNNGAGNAFSVGTDGSGFQNLISFTGTSGSASGANPFGGMAFTGSTLYGMTFGGAASTDGNIFSIGIGGVNYQNLFPFSGGSTSGQAPYGSLTVGGSTLFGMTSTGGSAGRGVLFSIGSNGTSYRNLLTFHGTDGNAPRGSLTLNGSTLYGMTSMGSNKLLGNIFSIGTNGTNYTNLVSFTGTSGSAEGVSPFGSLTLSGTTLYGMTSEGGVDGFGNIFSVGIDGSDFQNLYSFTGGSDGGYPYDDLTLSAGTLFGTAYQGGVNNNGTIFALTLPEPGTLALVGSLCLVCFVWCRPWRRLAIIAAIALLPTHFARANVFNMPNGQTSLQFVTVGDPGNVADSVVMMQDNTTGYGSVGYVYQIGKYDVTLRSTRSFSMRSPRRIVTAFTTTIWVPGVSFPSALAGGEPRAVLHMQ